MKEIIQIVKNGLLILLAVPLLGVLLGGVYSWPAIYFTKGKEPGLSLLLSLGLAITVFGLGFLGQLPLFYLISVWSIAILFLLVARKCFGGLGHNIERFGIVHAFALLFVFFIITFFQLGILK